MFLNNKQKKTLRRIFESPTRHLQIDWREIESLLKACGADILESDGSAIRIVLGERRIYLHRPHPCKEAKGYQVKALRELLRSNHIQP